MANDGADHGVPDVETDDALVGEVDFPRVALHLLGLLGRNLHAQGHQLLLPVLLYRNDVVVFGVALDVDGGAVELLGPQFLDLLYLMLEVAVFLLEKHVLELIVEILLPILAVDGKGVAVEGEGVGVCELPGFEGAGLGLPVGLDDPQVLGHLPGVNGDRFVVNDLLFDGLKAALVRLVFEHVVVVRQQRVRTQKILSVTPEHYNCAQVVLLQLVIFPV